MMMEMRYGGDKESFRFPAKIGPFPVIGGNGKSDVSLLSGFSNQKETCQTDVVPSWRPHIFNSPPRGGTELEEKKNSTCPVSLASVSWHPHVYSSPPKIFTPHCIEDIIGRDGEEPLNLTTREEQTAKRKKGPEEDRGRKKMRTTFTGRQIFELEKMFEVKKYLNSSERSDMSRLLNVTEQQVKIWFQNRRTKWKKQENVTNEEAAQLLKNKANGGEDSGDGKEDVQKKPVVKTNQQNIQKSLQQTSQNLQKSLQLNLQNPDQHSLQKSLQQSSSSLQKSLQPGVSFHPSIQQPNNQFDVKCLSMPILDSGLAAKGKSDFGDETPSSRTHDLGSSSGGEADDWREAAEEADDWREAGEEADDWREAGEEADDSEEELLSVGGDDKDSSNLETSELVIDEVGEVNKLNVQ